MLDDTLRVIPCSWQRDGPITLASDNWPTFLGPRCIRLTGEVPGHLKFSDRKIARVECRYERCRSAIRQLSDFPFVWALRMPMGPDCRRLPPLPDLLQTVLLLVLLTFQFIT
jgi:hypothetical protein